MIDENKLNSFEGVAQQLIEIANRLSVNSGKLTVSQTHLSMALADDAMDLRRIAAALGVRP